MKCKHNWHDTMEAKVCSVCVRDDIISEMKDEINSLKEYIKDLEFDIEWIKKEQQANYTVHA